SELESTGTRDFTAIGRLFFGYQAKNRRFARAIASDQTDVLARIDLKRCAAQNVLRAKGFVNVGKPKQHKTGSADVSPAERVAKHTVNSNYSTELPLNQLNFCYYQLLADGTSALPANQKRVRTQVLLARTRRIAKV